MPVSGHTASVPSNTLIRRWRERRREILKTLAPNLLAEYRKLGLLIKGVKAEESLYARVRSSMSVHKQKLIAFLREQGPTARAEIVAKTGIPSGSLSELLRDKEFKTSERGVWALVE
jgi:hypothetical protein